MKVCCGNGKPVSDMDTLDKLACNHDHCLGPIEEYLYKQMTYTVDEILTEFSELIEENT